MSWEENVRKVVPYTPGEQPKIKNIIKLNTNENPYPPAPSVYKAYEETELDDYRKYPDPTCSILVDSIASFYGVKKENVFVGVGSDDVLSMAFLTFFNSDKTILFPDITYSFYDVWADLYRIPYKQIPLNEDFTIDPADYHAENGGVVIANPNAPTGVTLGLEAIEDIIKSNPDVVVIVDEAYVDFGAETALPLIDKYDNLLVVRTYSKSRSLAGLRIGYAFGCEKLIKYLSDAKFSFNSYTMNMPSLTLGAAAMKDKEYFEETTAKVVATRERVKIQLKELGFEFGDSATNFIFARHPKMAGKEIFDYLRAHDIIVRRFNKPERISEYLRISIGTDEEMDTLISVLKEIV
ncbi:histidinol-phosphate transaminase [Butyrivibrio sp. DSM 10294]|uniref:histidinol-phosphate transaminase n=1 Tax=Butyrivibrio sp. DSM 10294 TaxID=2972457 RepID=UPI00234EA22C|nr:histidinol-phosphate transaminase [Butyrivibrio sp. DSM 10294]MDC7294840.1 histidinol-phosphate transaminase [Butyrivibrio sp. DSM 10294]